MRKKFSSAGGRRRKQYPDRRERGSRAILFAPDLAIRLHRPLAEAFCLAPEFPDAAFRQYSFMVRGHREVEGVLHDRSWGERPLFGTISTMSRAGCARKFDMAAYFRRNAAADGP